MQYSFKCPGCDHIVTVTAPDRQTAVDEMMKAGEEHSRQAHADMPPMDPTQMRQMVETQMKEEASVATKPQIPQEMPESSMSSSEPMSEVTPQESPMDSGMGSTEPTTNDTSGTGGDTGQSSGQV